MVASAIAKGTFKVLASVLLADAFIGLVVPPLNQRLTRNLRAKKEAEARRKAEDLATLPKDGGGRISLALAIPIAANIGGMGTPIGTPPNAIALGALEEAGYVVTFAGWMLSLSHGYSFRSYIHSRQRRSNSRLKDRRSRRLLSRSMWYGLHLHLPSSFGCSRAFSR